MGGEKAIAIDINKQIRLLESLDSRASSDAREALSLLISTGNGIAEMVRYYSDSKSERALDLLLSVQDQHNKKLLDTIMEEMKANTEQIIPMLVLLGQLVQANPSWTPKIPLHQLFRFIIEQVINQQKRAANTRVCLSILFFITELLPFTSNLDSSILSLLFRTFLSACSCYKSKCQTLYQHRLPNEVSLVSPEEEKINKEIQEIDLLHLALAILRYFQILYGIYPQNFLAYLRQFFSNRERDKDHLFDTVVEPLLNTVRLHPYLIILNKESEISRERWNKREPHDFLHDSRRVVIDDIPPHGHSIGSLFGATNEPDSPSAVNPSRFSLLFHSNDGSSDSSFFPQMDERIMESLNTPPGSVAQTPTKRRSCTNDVITNDDRIRQRSVSGQNIESSSTNRSSSTSFKLSLSNLASNFRKPSSKNRRSEVLEISGKGKDCDLAFGEEADECEEALHVDFSIGPSPVTTTRTFSSTKSQHPYSPSKFPSDTSSSRSPTVFPRPPSNKSIGEKSTLARQSEMDSREPGLWLAQAANAARERAQTVQQSRFNVEKAETDGDARSRASSLRPLTPSSTLIQDERTSTMSTAIGGDSETWDRDSRSRLDGGSDILGTMSNVVLDAKAFHPDSTRHTSVATLMERLNRKRFVSECPDSNERLLLTANDDTIAKKYPGRVTARKFQRTFSLPDYSAVDIFEDETKLLSEIKQPSKREELDVEALFPYRKLISYPTQQQLEEFEKKLEAGHETQRVEYMKRSKDYHGCLKNLALADKLPGKIYDDLSHITKQVDKDKALEVLRTRLLLVNQHLLYERSCRLLHANRNRRLFGRIKMQKITEAELENLKESLMAKESEMSELVNAITELRKSRISEGHKSCEWENKLKDKVKSLEMQLEQAKRDVHMASARQNEAEQREKVLREQVDSYRRTAEDALVRMEMYKKMATKMDEKTEELRLAHADNQQLRDQLAMNVDLVDEKLKAKGNEERLQKQLDAMKLQLEKMRVERDCCRVKLEQNGDKLLRVEQEKEAEMQRSKELKVLLDRAGRLLDIRHEAAEQRFLSLQIVTRKQEGVISELHEEIERLNDKKASGVSEGEGDTAAVAEGSQQMSGRPTVVPRRSVMPVEVRSYENSYPDSLYFNLTVTQPSESYDNEEPAGGSQTEAHSEFDNIEI